MSKSANFILKKLLVFGLIYVLAFSAMGCAIESSSTVSPASEKAPDVVWAEKATNAWVVAHSQDWDCDAEDDGIRVWVELLDKNEKMIEYENMTMPVKIEIYSTESKTFPSKPSRLIYSATARLHNWYEDAFVSGAVGVKDISWEEISPPLPSEQQEYGLIYVTVTLPNGKAYSARDDARITP